MAVRLGVPLDPDAVEFAALLTLIRESGQWSNNGPLVKQLEQWFATSQQWGNAAAVSSGTSALHVALLALGLEPGSEVITSPLTFRATALAIEAAGLVPVFVAVEPDSLNLDPRAVEAAISNRTSAILPVHLFGLPADPELDAVGARHDVPVVYDAAHAFGAVGIAGRGAAAAYSLHATKILHTGEGGMIATDSPELAVRIRRTRSFGTDGPESPQAGVNAKLSEVSAAVGLAMLSRLEQETAARRSIRDRYRAALELSSRLREHAPGRDRAFVFEPVRCAPLERESIINELAAAGVETRVFPALCEPGDRWETAPMNAGDRRDTIELASSVVALPIHGRITEGQLDAIVTVLAR